MANTPVKAVATVLPFPGRKHVRQIDRRVLRLIAEAAEILRRPAARPPKPKYS